MVCLEGFAINWESILQGVVVQSTTKVDYFEISMGFKEAYWLGGFVGELRLERRVNTIFCESQSFIALAMNSNYNYKRMKHAMVKIYFLPGNLSIAKT